MSKKKASTDTDFTIPRVELLGTEIRSIDSSIIPYQKFDLYINFPRSYADFNTRGIYPVLYVLNGQWDFPLVLGSFGNLFFDGYLNEMIIVGVTWHGDYLDYHKLMARDFTPTKTDGINSGGAEKFLLSTEKDIIPFIESQYPVTKDRGLAGGSLPGLFALFAMFHDSQLFNKYIVSSPNIQWDNGFILNQEAVYAQNNSDLSVNLCITWGEHESSDWIKKFINQLQSRTYNSLKLESFEITNTGHASNKPAGFTYGMQSVYKRREMMLPLENLKLYEGVYKTEEGKEIIIQTKDDHLTIKFNRQDYGIRIFAENEYHFYIKNRFAFIHFKTTKGDITHMDFELFNKIHKATKTSDL